MVLLAEFQSAGTIHAASVAMILRTVAIYSPKPLIAATRYWPLIVPVDMACASCTVGGWNYPTSWTRNLKSSPSLTADVGSKNGGLIGVMTYGPLPELFSGFTPARLSIG
jgi:hypothetical protein